MIRQWYLSLKVKVKLKFSSLTIELLVTKMQLIRKEPETNDTKKIEKIWCLYNSCLKKNVKW